MAHRAKGNLNTASTAEHGPHGPSRRAVGYTPRLILGSPERAGYLRHHVFDDVFAAATRVRQ
jgi:hypothetical protein